MDHRELLRAAQTLIGELTGARSEQQILMERINFVDHLTLAGPDEIHE
ncbi:hypothetical protein LX15_003682 [Streptoalloteichus tenebrarius]|uniref:Transposase n=1 Tax=Streptoalloteichus tenebrarius (strain ATCC 17920 / DSM 40477 / JCM 4838 / CBS 697.72 / NBRC 16177 / NCIMB 11028 / NRRL B-12390 / A12253. 1 / ISP 5477) TaxID=1933 RepID=A0ABT1HWU6_STRSD|nr:hypothetical protein [Streptoalloteichus tenebrarius]MCP2259971.1 hypothetical protein [Streptoalloteichus tenebrarius]BFF03920.1 hypothetical protein GCM10020241_55950 [Streptoalloteichus tenebrarius]